MRSVAAIAVAGLIAASCQKGPTFDDFRRVVTGVAGPGARDCGMVPLNETNHRVLDCAKEAISRKEAFSIIVRRQGIDSEIFSGIAQSKDGEIWNVDWDSDVSGGSGSGSAMNRRRCVRIEFQASLYAHDSLQCVP